MISSTRDAASMREAPWSFEFEPEYDSLEENRYENLQDYDWYSEKFTNLDKKQLNRSILKEPEYLMELVRVFAFYFG